LYGKLLFAIYNAYLCAIDPFLPSRYVTQDYCHKNYLSVRITAMADGNQIGKRFMKYLNSHFPEVFHPLRDA
jgi:hypothetical protein